MSKKVPAKADKSRTAIVTIANQKGGVGKTTVLVHCAFLAAERSDRPCLVIELCPQGNASQTLYGPDYGEQTCEVSCDLLLDDTLKYEPLVTQNNVHIFPASEGLADLDEVADIGQLLARFTRHVRHLADSGKYCFIFIDTPPSLGKLQLCGLAAADYVVSPTSLSSYALTGLEKLLETIIAVQNELNPDLEFLGILPNLVNANRREQLSALKAIVKEFGNKVFDTPIRDRGPIADAVDNGQPVWKQPKSGNARTAGDEMRRAIAKILDGVKA